MQTELFVAHIMRGAGLCGQRTGQYLFNHLPDEAATAVAGTLFDPFNKELSRTEVEDWLDNHLIFDGQQIIGVFNNDQLLWEFQVKSNA